MYRKKRQLFFKNKKCHYCKKPGTTFRLINSKHEILCDAKDCDKKSRVKADYFGSIINI